MADTNRHINCESDFSFLLSLTDRDGHPVAFPDCDWHLALFSKSGFGRKYSASSVGGKLTNCVAEEGGAVRIVCDRHGLGRGELLAKLYVNWPDALYSDGRRLDVRPFPVGIKLVDGPSDGAADFSAEASLPVVAVSAYELAVSQGYQGTQAEFYAALTRLPSLVGEADVKFSELRQAIEDAQSEIADTQREAGRAISQALSDAQDGIGQAQQAIEDTRQSVEKAISEGAAAVIASAATLRLDRETGRLLLTFND